MFAIDSPFFVSFSEAISTSDCKLFPIRDQFLAFSVDRVKAMS